MKKTNRCANALLIATLAACGGEEDPAAGRGKSCETLSDCSGGSVCLRSGGVSACALECSLEADACSVNAQCAGVGSIDVQVCQPAPENPEQPTPEEQPKIPCQSDAECQSLHPDAVCAEFQGVRDCTIRCEQEEDCDLLGFTAGVRVDFATCIADEGDASRTVCLPDVRCFQDVTACVSIDAGSFPGIDDDWDGSSGLPGGR